MDPASSPALHWDTGPRNHHSAYTVMVKSLSVVTTSSRRRGLTLASVFLVVLMFTTLELARISHFPIFQQYASLYICQKTGATPATPLHVANFLMALWLNSPVMKATPWREIINISPVSMASGTTRFRSAASKSKVFDFGYFNNELSLLIKEKKVIY